MLEAPETDAGIELSRDDPVVGIDLTPPEAMPEAAVQPAPHVLHEIHDFAQKIDGQDGMTRSKLYIAGGKVLLDLAFLVVAAPLWLPLYLIVAAVLLVAQGRPIHYRQSRAGKHGSSFDILKFRTMQEDADAQLMRLVAEDPGLEAEFRLRVKLRSDPRLTPVGKILRRYCLDEIPQLFNVLRREMSIVGPRPVREAEWTNCYGPAAPIAFGLRPGLTGLWQVSRGPATSYEQRVYLDMHYAATCSLRTDLSIMVRTLPSIVRGHGAF